jgi:hypothetical protein
MPKRDTWGAGADAPVCPNNTRHGLRPDAQGGYRCDTCTEELAGTRSREATRWAFATIPAVPLDAGADTE